MTDEEFRSIYDPKYKCYATYTDDYGYKDSGLILDTIKFRIGGIPFLQIDNFSNTVLLERVFKIENSNNPWRLS